MASSRGQVGFEYLIFTTFLLIVVVILFAYAFTIYSQSIQLVQTQAAVDSLSSAVDFVYAKGPGNSILLNITLPQGLSELRVDQNYVIATLHQGGSPTHVFAFTKAHIDSRFLFFEQGPYTLRVTMGDVNVHVVNI
ncbi:MAG: hypothetical protein Q8P05_02860 [Candidatus Diapherotrites archaeon]|nr:hypothetical protein [Candidatus Diapherotrites archaeon]MDZ4256005.1 hypothetical protein [archaeon]